MKFLSVKLALRFSHKKFLNLQIFKSKTRQSIKTFILQTSKRIQFGRVLLVPHASCRHPDSPSNTLKNSTQRQATFNRMGIDFVPWILYGLKPPELLNRPLVIKTWNMTVRTWDTPFFLLSNATTCFIFSTQSDLHQIATGYKTAGIRYTCKPTVMTEDFSVFVKNAKMAYDTCSATKFLTHYLDLSFRKQQKCFKVSISGDLILCFLNVLIKVSIKCFR